LARKILLADDSVTAQNMGRKILSDAGYEVLTVNNGPAALKRIAEARPNLVILDIYMPGYTGLEVCQRLKESPETADIPVLLAVGKLEPFKPQEARRVMADAHIVKPFEATQLLAAIKELENSKPTRAPEARISPFAKAVSRNRADEAAQARIAEVSFGKNARERSLGDNRKANPHPASHAEAASVAHRETVTHEAAGHGSSAAFRDFRKHETRSPAPVPAPATTLPVNPPEPSGEVTDSVPNLPQDITADELNALIAVAAKLEEQGQGKIAVAEACADAKLQPPSTVSATSFAVEPAPVDREDEPLFVSAQAETTTIIPVDPGDSADGNAQSDTPAADAPAPSEEELAKALLLVTPVSEPHEAAPVDREDEPQFVSAQAETTMVPGDAGGDASASAQSESPAAETLAPGDEDVAKALLLLTPVAEPQAATRVEEGDMPGQEAHFEEMQGDAASGEVLSGPAQDVLATQPAPSAPARWIAEPVQLTAEEATLSLEAEMFRACAESTKAAPSEAAKGRMAEIQAAVDQRVAEAEAEPVPGTTEKTMAAAAPAGVTSAPAVDEQALASIVEKVMADLRPKIVEEIARKLSEK